MEEEDNEAYQNIGYGKTAEYSEKGRLWGMPDILPVSMQNILYGGKSELREQIEDKFISRKGKLRGESRRFLVCVGGFVTYGLSSSVQK